MYIWIFFPLILAIILYYKYRRQIYYELECTENLTSLNNSLNLNPERKPRMKTLTLQNKSFSYPHIETDNEQPCFPVNKLPDVSSKEQKSVFKPEIKPCTLKRKIITKIMENKKHEKKLEALPQKTSIELEVTKLNNPDAKTSPRNKSKIPIPLLAKKNRSKALIENIFPDNRDNSEIEATRNTEISPTVSSDFQPEVSDKPLLSDGISETSEQQSSSLYGSTPHSPVLDISQFLKRQNVKKKKPAKKKKK